MKKCAAIIALCLLSACSPSVSKTPPPPPPKKEISPEQMQEAMVKASTIGAKHRALDPLIGNYKVEAKFWMKPGTPPQMETGTAEFQWVLGGHYVAMNYHSAFQGQPYEGQALYGYNNVRNQYESTYADSMGTEIMKNFGSANQKGTVITFGGEFMCPITNGPMKTREIFTIGSDRHVYEMYHPAFDGSGEFKAMELTFVKVPGKTAGKTTGKAAGKSKHKHK